MLATTSSVRGSHLIKEVRVSDQRAVRLTLVVTEGEPFIIGSRPSADSSYEDGTSVLWKFALNAANATMAETIPTRPEQNEHVVYVGRPEQHDAQTNNG